MRDAGYSQETYYTYILNTSSSEEKIVNGYRENIRREIRKAEKVNVIKEIDIKKFADIYIDTFNNQGLTPPVSREKLFEIDEVVEKRVKPEESVLKNAPHTIFCLADENWKFSYSKEKAVFPLPYVKENKFWPSVRRVDDAFGDRNLHCSCAPIEDYQ